MIQFNSNGNQVFDAIKADIEKKISRDETDRLLRTIASTLTALMRNRVHVQGKDANDAQIGTYSPEYMKVRTDNFKSQKIVRGKKKGQDRKKYKRTADTKVVLSLSRNMENDMAICEQNPFKTTYGYAIGYHKEMNFDKLTKLELKYGRPILTKLSKHEEEIKDEIVQNFLNDRATN